MKGLGIACVAREALPAYLFGELLGWSKANDSEAFLRATRPFLLQEPAQWHHGNPAFRPYHNCFREFVADKLGERTIRELHGRIADRLAVWPPDEQDPTRRTYALRHAVAHRIEAGDVRAAQRLCTDVGYLELKCRLFGVTAIERDLEATVRAPGGDVSLDLTAVLVAVSAEANHLHADASSLPALLYNRLRCAGWSAERIEGVLRFPAGLPPLRLLHRVHLGTTLLRSFLGHEKSVVACVAMPDGTHILSASTDRTLRLWTLGSDECIAVLRGHDDELTACAIAPDGRTAISTSADATVKVWDLVAHSCIATLTNDGRWSTACAVTPDGLRLVVGSDDGSLRVWDRSSLESVATLSGHTDYITACAVTPDNRRIVSASRDQSVRVWDLASGECLHTLGRAEPGEAQAPRGMEEQRWITALAVTPDGRYAVAAAGDGALSQWDLTSGRFVERFSAGPGRVDACTITRDGVYLLCGIADGTIRIWNLMAARCVGHWKAHAAAVSACSATLDGRRVVSASSDRSLQLWDISAPERTDSEEQHKEPITACSITPDGAIAVSASEDRTLKVWDLATGACCVTLEGHEDLVTSCAVSADGRRVASGARDGSLRVWRISSPEPPDVLRGHAGLVSGCAITPDGLLLTASHDRTLQLWSLDRLERITTFEGHGDAVECCAMTPDGTRALSVSRDGAVRVWDLAARACKQSLDGLGDGLRCGALIPDRRRVVLAREDGTLEVRDLRTGQRTIAFGRHAGRIFGIAVSPDGTRVVSASEDKTIKVWDIAAGALLGTLHGTQWFRCVALSKELICAGDQEGNLWTVASSAAQPRALEPTPSARAAAAHLPRLREILAGLYPLAEDARIVASDAGLDITRLDLSGNAARFWQAILVEAQHQNRLGAVARCVQRQYRDYFDLNEQLRALGFESSPPR
jgi:WD40 repeat protein